jgi:hypothetical protein
MEEQMLDVIDNLIDGRNMFVSRIGQISHPQRPTMLSRFMMNEIIYLEIINRVYNTHNRNNLTQAVMTLTVPPNFMDPVNVAPTAQQVENAIEHIVTTTADCAICQDSISSNGVKLRHCGHVYHHSCLLSWFAVSVRCPVCRHDIREGQAAQTHAVSAQTSSQSSTQSEETDTSE